MEKYTPLQLALESPTGLYSECEIVLLLLEHGAEIPDLKAAKQVMQLMQKAYRHEVTP